MTTNKAWVEKWQDAAGRWSSTTLLQEALDRAISRLRDLLEGEEAQAIKALLEAAGKQGQNGFRSITVFGNYGLYASGLYRHVNEIMSSRLEPATTDEIVSSLFESQVRFGQKCNPNDQNEVRIRIKGIIAQMRRKLSDLADLAPSWPAQ